jgi:hypothetical protein
MAVPSSRSTGKAGRVLAGVACGGLLGIGIGALALRVFPWDPAAFGGEYHGLFTIVLFCAPVLVAYAVLGVILGVVGALRPSGRRLLGLAVGAAVGLAGALGVIVASPRFFGGRSVSDGTEVFPDGMITMVIALMVIVAGAVIGRKWGPRWFGPAAEERDRGQERSLPENGS